MKKTLKFLKKILFENYCDTCGFTKDKVYTTELYMEAGLRQCNKCFSKDAKIKNKEL